ncbi:MAG: RuBisCO operon transcriptional regulator CbbR, partial [uncultured Acetobacteraceae bacterium]
ERKTYGLRPANLAAPAPRHGRGRPHGHRDRRGAAPFRHAAGSGAAAPPVGGSARRRGAARTRRRGRAAHRRGARSSHRPWPGGGGAARLFRGDRGAARHGRRPRGGGRDQHRQVLRPLRARRLPARAPEGGAAHPRREPPGNGRRARSFGDGRRRDGPPARALPRRARGDRRPSARHHRPARPRAGGTARRSARRGRARDLPAARAGVGHARADAPPFHGGRTAARRGNRDRQQRDDQAGGDGRHGRGPALRPHHRGGGEGRAAHRAGRRGPAGRPAVVRRPAPRQAPAARGPGALGPLRAVRRALPATGGGGHATRGAQEAL